MAPQPVAAAFITAGAALLIVLEVLRQCRKIRGELPAESRASPRPQKDSGSTVVVTVRPDLSAENAPQATLVPRTVSTGGRHLDVEEIRVVSQCKDLLVFDKPYDCRLDGESEEPTVERAARHVDPGLDKIRFCNQLDYATSGLMVLGRTKAGAREASQCFEKRTSMKYYITIGHGHCHRDGPFQIEGALAAVEGDFRMSLVTDRPADGYGPHGGPASTLALCLARGEVAGRPASIFLLRPLTGRRHQLRLHMAHLGHPVMGDATYSPVDAEERCVERMMLHAWRLELPLRSRRRIFETPEPFSKYFPGDWPSHLADAVEKLASIEVQ